MFDIVAKKQIVVTGFECDMEQYGEGPWKIEIYGRTGTHAGHELSSDGWTLLGSKTPFTIPDVGIYDIPIELNVALNAGDRYGFYITYNNDTGFSDGDTNYVSGDEAGETIASNSDLEVINGSGIIYPFADTFTPRNFIGIVKYKK